MPIGDSSHDDLAAALAARHELGDDYDWALARGFVDRVAGEIDAKVDERLALVASTSPRRRQRGSVFLAVSSLTLGIPLSAIAGDFGHLGGLCVAWGGIVLVNVAHSLRRERGGPPVAGLTGQRRLR